jgi:phage terminase large subunit
MVMCFFQYYKNEYRIIDEYYAEGEGLEHYVKTMYEMYENITNIILPHDVKVRELSSGRSRLDLIRGLGVKNITVLPKSNLADGIEAVRAILPKLWIDKKCEYLRACFLNYSKAWDVDSCHI